MRDYINRLMYAMAAVTASAISSRIPAMIQTQTLLPISLSYIGWAWELSRRQALSYSALMALMNFMTSLPSSGVQR